MKQKNYEKAIELFNQAIIENPNDKSLYSKRSACYCYLKNFARALEDANKCIQIDPDWSIGYYRKGMALTGLGQFREAMGSYGIGQ